MRRPFALLALALLAVSCGGKDGGANGRVKTNGTVNTNGGSAATSEVADTDAATDGLVGIPAECSPAPFTVVAQREGKQPAGSATFGVIGAAALPIPLVPDKAGALTPEQATAQGQATNLLGYVMFFGDEQFGPADVSMFGGYAPIADGAIRGTVSIFPKNTTPIGVGDTLTPGPLDGLEMVTTLQSVLMDFKATPDELTSYLNEIAGSVTVLGLTPLALCLDVDLTWEYSNGSEAKGTLTLKGIFTAPLAPRSLPFT